jgi:hypothetical protein
MRVLVTIFLIITFIFQTVAWAEDCKVTEYKDSSGNVFKKYIGNECEKIIDREQLQAGQQKDNKIRRMPVGQGDVCCICYQGKYYIICKGRCCS